MGESPVCTSCGASLDAVQRYCIECGEPRPGVAARTPAAPPPAAEVPPSGSPRMLARLPRFSMPDPRQAAALVAAALSVGVITGRAIDNRSFAADGPAGLLAQAPAGRGGEGASGSSTGQALSAPEGNVSEPASSAPAAEAPAEEPAPTPEPEPSTPAAEAPADTAPAKEKKEPAKPASKGRDVSGTVVHTNPGAHGYSLSTTDGALIAVHAADVPDVGAGLSTTVFKVANGTYRERGRKATSTDPAARLRGTVTYVDSLARAYVVSAPGTSLSVRVPVGGELPVLAARVNATVHFEAPAAGSPDPVRLVADSLETEGTATGPIPLAATVKAVDPLTGVVSLSADDVDELGGELAVASPAGSDLSALAVGDPIVARVEIGADGAYRFTEAHPNTDLKQAAGDHDLLAGGTQSG